jgi:hypothetical protein
MVIFKSHKSRFNLTCNRVTQISMPVTLARSTHIRIGRRASKVPQNTRLTPITVRHVGALQAHSIVDRSLEQVLLQLKLGHVLRHRQHFTGHTQIGVAVTMDAARHTLAAILGIADKQRATLVALLAHRFVVAFQAFGQFVGTGTVGVAVALALDGTVGANVAE